MNDQALFYCTFIMFTLRLIVQQTYQKNIISITNRFNNKRHTNSNFFSLFVIPSYCSISTHLLVNLYFFFEGIHAYLLCVLHFFAAFINNSFLSLSLEHYLCVHFKKKNLLFRFDHKRGRQKERKITFINNVRAIRIITFMDMDTISYANLYSFFFISRERNWMV